MVPIVKVPNSLVLFLPKLVDTVVNDMQSTKVFKMSFTNSPL